MKTAVLGLLTGHGALVPALALAAVAALIFLVTARLARHADTIAEHTGLGRLWIGSVLLAATTSLPELLTESVLVVVTYALAAWLLARAGA